jgi:hypothetical protein
MFPLPHSLALRSNDSVGERDGRYPAVVACLLLLGASGCVTAAPHDAANYPPNRPIDCTSTHGVPVMWTTFTGLGALASVSIASTAKPMDGEAKKQRDFALGFSIVNSIAAGVAAVHSYLTVEQCREAKGGHWYKDFETQEDPLPRPTRARAAPPAGSAAPSAGPTPSEQKGASPKPADGVPSASFPETPQGAAPARGAGGGQPGIRDGSVSD